MTISREALEKFYEEETGLDAKRGSTRVDHLEKFCKTHNLDITDISIVNDTRKMSKDHRNGLSWHAGKEYEGTICLGYTSGRGIGQYKNAIFEYSAKLEQAYLDASL